MYLEVSPASNVPVLEPLSDPENEGPELIGIISPLPSVRTSLMVKLVRVTFPLFLTEIM